jgi:uncharacterized protein
MLSEERQSHFAHIIVDGIWNDDLVEYTDEDAAMRFAKKGVVSFVQEYKEIDEKVCNTVRSLKRNVPEGSTEWDVLYAKYFEEELQRRGS